MTILRLEHPITDFETWKRAFDRDPVQRKASGVRSHRIYRPVDDPKYVAVDLEFATRDEAERFEVALGNLWRSREAAPALAGTPIVRIVDSVETTIY
jgi:hypothetical protein